MYNSLSSIPRSTKTLLNFDDFIIYPSVSKYLGLPSIINALSCANNSYAVLTSLPQYVRCVTTSLP